jgi:hypothetical protein
MKHLLRKYEAELRSMKHSLRSYDFMRVSALHFSCAEGALHRAKPCFILHARQRASFFMSQRLAS